MIGVKVELDPAHSWFWTMHPNICHKDISLPKVAAPRKGAKNNRIGVRPSISMAPLCRCDDDCGSLCDWRPVEVVARPAFSLPIEHTN